MKRLLIAVWFISWSSCVHAQPTAIRIDPAQARGGTASQIFEEVHYIPLETTKESLFGKIDQLAVTENYFIILDEETNSILIFKKNGEFHAKIVGGGTQLGNMTSKRYWNNIQEFYTIESTRQIVISRHYPQKIKKGLEMIYEFYNFDGKKIKQGSPVFDVWDRYYFSSDTIAYSDYYVKDYYPDSISHELFTAVKNKIYKEYLPYNKKTASLEAEDILSVGGGSFHSIGEDTLVLLTRSYDHTIYQLTPATFIPRFQFIFPFANSLPKGFTTDPSYKGLRKKTLLDNPDYIYGIGYTYLMGDNLFFKLGARGVSLRDNNSFIYNVKSGNLISVTRISPDSSTSFLPVTDSRLGIDFSNSNFGFCDGKYVYTSYSSLITFQAKEATKDRNPLYPPGLENFFNTESRKSNPVIVQLKPKENL